MAVTDSLLKPPPLRPAQEKSPVSRASSMGRDGIEPSTLGLKGGPGRFGPIRWVRKSAALGRAFLQSGRVRFGSSRARLLLLCYSDAVETLLRRGWWIGMPRRRGGQFEPTPDPPLGFPIKPPVAARGYPQSDGPPLAG
jgi:hypothetical protein